MITKKELQYVDSWASKIPMPRNEYSMMVLKEMKECVEIYSNLYKGKDYNLNFSNGEEMNFSIQSKNLCHMMGIDYDNLKSDFFEDYRKEILKINSIDFTSYDLLCSIIEHSDQVAINDNLNRREKIINYYKSGIKCQIFKKLNDFSKFDFAAINYDKGDERFDYKNQKIFFVPSNEHLCPYFMMFLKKDNNSSEGNYIVTGLYAPMEPKKYFENQEVIIPTQLLITDNEKLTKLVATPEEKIHLLALYKSIIATYNIPNKINIYGDYEATLNDLTQKNKILIK